MAPKYKFTYWNIMAIAEPIRLIFAAANVDYEDVRIEEEDWPTLKPTTPWGQLPTLEFDGVTLSQSATIARYLARKYGLMGESEIEAAKCDEYVDVVIDMRKECLKYFHPEESEDKSAIKKTLEEETLPRYFTKFTEILEKQGNGHLVGKKLSLADIYVANKCLSLCKLLSPTLLDNHRLLKKFCEDVMSSPGIKEWVERRPETEF